MPESDGNPIAESDNFFFASIVESDKFLAIVKSYGNPITESDKFFLVLVMVKSDANSIAESDKLVTQRPRAKREANGSWSMCHLERSALLRDHGLPTYSGEALS